MSEGQHQIGAVVVLSGAEQAIARYIARQRFLGNRKAGVNNSRVGPQTDEATDLNGFASELAFCKLFNVYPDFSIAPRRGGHDCEQLGVRIDAKHTVYRNGHLLAVVGKQQSAADIYALMVGQFPEFRFVGCVSGVELLRDEHIADFGHGPTYAIDQAGLFSYCYSHGTYPGEGNCPGCEKQFFR